LVDSDPYLDLGLIFRISGYITLLMFKHYIIK
jgi:hypothetical protein